VTYVALEAFTHTQPGGQVESRLGPCELPGDSPERLYASCRVPLRRSKGDEGLAGLRRRRMSGAAWFREVESSQGR
jgi:hypothetical protein